jgi:hypothetical protein
VTDGTVFAAPLPLGQEETDYCLKRPAQTGLTDGKKFRRAINFGISSHSQTPPKKEHFAVITAFKAARKRKLICPRHEVSVFT